MTSAAEQYRILSAGSGAVWLRRDVIRANGAEVMTYLQGQLSQDMDKVAVGQTTWSWLLQPHGKVDALIRVSRIGESELIIDVDSGFSDLVIERLDRFKMRTKAAFTPLSWKVLGLRGPKSQRPEGELVEEINWPGFSGYDVFGDDPVLPDGATLCDFDVYETLRIENGVPRMGSELDQLTIPAEAGINERTISFTKGCYTGQELVARIDSRGGNVPRNLRVLVIDAEEAVPRGSKITGINASTIAKPYGVITSSAFSPRLNQAVALAFIRREIQVGAKAEVIWDRGPSVCTIERPPLEQ